MLPKQYELAPIRILQTVAFADFILVVCATLDSRQAGNMHLINQGQGGAGHMYKCVELDVYLWSKAGHISVGGGFIYHQKPNNRHLSAHVSSFCGNQFFSG